MWKLVGRPKRKSLLKLPPWDSGIKVWLNLHWVGAPVSLFIGSTNFYLTHSREECESLDWRQKDLGDSRASRTRLQSLRFLGWGDSGDPWQEHHLTPGSWDLAWSWGREGEAPWGEGGWHLPTLKELFLENGTLFWVSSFWFLTTEVKMSLGVPIKERGQCWGYQSQTCVFNICLCDFWLSGKSLSLSMPQNNRIIRIFHIGFLRGLTEWIDTEAAR